MTVSENCRRCGMEPANNVDREGDHYCDECFAKLPPGSQDHFSILMPFVVCASNGGPLEDQAFICGVQFGQIWQLFHTHPPLVLSLYVNSLIVPQLDLLAMHCGYVFKAQPWEDRPDEWTLVSFTRST